MGHKMVVKVVQARKKRVAKSKNVQWIANGQSGPHVVRIVVQDTKPDHSQWRHNMVVKFVQARKKRVAKSKTVEYKYSFPTTPPRLVGTHASNNQQLASQETLNI